MARSPIRVIAALGDVSWRKDQSKQVFLTNLYRFFNSFSVFTATHHRHVKMHHDPLDHSFMRRPVSKRKRTTRNRMILHFSISIVMSIATLVAARLIEI